MVDVHSAVVRITVEIINFIFLDEQEATYSNRIFREKERWQK